MSDQFSLILERGQLSIQPGQTLTMACLLTNLSAPATRVDVRIVGMAREWVRAEPAWAMLPPGAQMECQLILFPPLTLPGKVYPVIVAAVDSLGQLLAQTSLSVRVIASGVFSLELSPRAITNLEGGPFKVTATNYGTTELTIELSAESDQPADFDFQPRLLSIPPQTRVESNLSSQSDLSSESNPSSWRTWASDRLPSHRPNHSVESNLRVTAHQVAPPVVPIDFRVWGQPRDEGTLPQSVAGRYTPARPPILTTQRVLWLGVLPLLCMMLWLVLSLPSPTPAATIVVTTTGTVQYTVVFTVTPGASSTQPPPATSPVTAVIRPGDAATPTVPNSGPSTRVPDAATRSPATPGGPLIAPTSPPNSPPTRAPRATDSPLPTYTLIPPQAGGGAVYLPADLAMTVSGDGNPVAGGTYSYTIRVENQSDNAAQEVSFLSSLPDAAEWVSDEPGAWTCSSRPLGQGGQYQCGLATLAAHGSSAFKVTVHILPDTTKAKPLTVLATVSSRYDLNPANNNGRLDKDIRIEFCVELTLSGGQSIGEGDNATYTLTARHTGGLSVARGSLLVNATPPATVTLNSTSDVFLTKAGDSHPYTFTVDKPGANAYTLVAEFQAGVDGNDNANCPLARVSSSLNVYTLTPTPTATNTATTTPSPTDTPTVTSTPKPWTISGEVDINDQGHIRGAEGIVVQFEQISGGPTPIGTTTTTVSGQYSFSNNSTTGQVRWRVAPGPYSVTPEFHEKSVYFGYGWQQDTNFTLVPFTATPTASATSTATRTPTSVTSTPSPIATPTASATSIPTATETPQLTVRFTSTPLSATRGTPTVIPIQLGYTAGLGNTAADVTFTLIPLSVEGQNATVNQIRITTPSVDGFANCSPLTSPSIGFICQALLLPRGYSQTAQIEVTIDAQSQITRITWQATLSSTTPSLSTSVPETMTVN